MQGAPPRARERRVLTTVGWMAGPDAFESYEPFVRGGGLPVKLSAYRPPRRARKESPVAVLNVHERVLTCSEEALASLIDGLAGDEDRLWPRGAWPPMTFDRPLEVGATGGHGPIRYRVSDYVRGHWIRFRFTEPRGLEKTASTARARDHRIALPGRAVEPLRSAPAPPPTSAPGSVKRERAAGA